ncbi:MAG TPA: beta-ketoacyl-[acyl-carrier-protein] synthase family protein [Verrucomicrobiae bacterium]|nr:beta-ketoacyl-[acyl-carrier-protein] synthase family protein [Verrucomicrobiae bacterium]
MGQRRRVVVTGLGLMTACGKGWQPFWEAACQSRSAIHPMQGLSLNGFPSRFAAQVLNADPKEMVRNRKSLKVMSRDIQLAVAASELAVQDSGLDPKQTDVFRFGVALGVSAPINTELDEMGVGIRNGLDAEGRFGISKFGREGIRSLFPLWFLKYVPNMPACHVSIAHGIKGPSNTITTSAAAAAQAVGEAFRIIERGDADCMLAGGTESEVNPMGLSRLHLLGLLSVRNGNALTAYRPFDKSRDGIVIGEGAGLLVLEAYEHAKARGARIYAEITGYGSSSDFDTDPRDTRDGEGKAQAMASALKDAGLSASDVDFIVANGSGLPRQDLEEAAAIHSVFNGRGGKVPVTGFKPVTGHLVYGAGAVEAAGGLLSLKEGLLPPLMNLENPEGGLDFVRAAPRQGTWNRFLLNSFGFAGQNASLVFQKC